jgi:hypothetical protein
MSRDTAFEVCDAQRMGGSSGQFHLAFRYLQHDYVRNPFPILENFMTLFRDSVLIILKPSFSSNR